ncbi:hypothetical protein JCM14469_36460 [Desulfatiferula olefinivorans]
MKTRYPFIVALALSLAVFVGCSDDDDAPAPAPQSLSFDSVGDDMRRCAPDLSTLAVTDWENGDNGWSGHVQYGVLKKHFDANSGNESIYATVLMIDSVLANIAASLPATALEGEGTVTDGEWTVEYAQVSEPVTLPPVFGGAAVDDFENYMAMTGYMDDMDSEYLAYFYYKPAGDDGIEKMAYRYQITAENERGNLYVVRDTNTHDLEVWVAGIKGGALPAEGSAHADAEHRVCLNFVGNTEAQTFRFRLKTDAAQGWAFWGGGTIASDDGVIAVRGTDMADSATYANNGTGITDDSADTTYVVLTFGQMKDNTFNGNGYPKAATAVNLGGETASAAGCISFGGADCLHASLAAAQSFGYPEAASDLGFAP